MNIVDIRLEEIKPYPNNPRNNETAIEQVKKSIGQFGFRQPIVVDKNNIIIVGHTRYYAASELKLITVPVLVASDLNDKQCKAYRIADNKTNEFAKWDIDLLRDEFMDLAGCFTGFTDAEINELMLDDTKTGLTDDDAVPEIPEEPIAKLGNIYQLGNHRLMCGDSTETDHVKKLMNNEKADLLFTDPPYGMSYGGGRAKGGNSLSKNGGVLNKTHGEIIGDELRDNELLRMVSSSIKNSLDLAKEEIPVYICFIWRTYSEFYNALTSIGKEPKSCIVWDKRSIGLGHGNYRPQHEFIFYCGGQWFGDRSQSDVWAMSRGSTSQYVHPTQKPVELIIKAIQNSSKVDDIIHDCFGGSGSTLIACEKINRSARLMELDPRYVDVIIKRWQDFTGMEAVKIGSYNG